MTDEHAMTPEAHLEQVQALRKGYQAHMSARGSTNAAKRDQAVQDLIEDSRTAQKLLAYEDDSVVRNIFNEAAEVAVVHVVAEERGATGRYPDLTEEEIENRLGVLAEQASDDYDYAVDAMVVHGKLINLQHRVKQSLGGTELKQIQTRSRLLKRIDEVAKPLKKKIRTKFGIDAKSIK